MKKASITDAKNGLSALIDSVKKGATVLIVDRGRPVAKLEPVTSGPHTDVDGRLSRLVRDGVVRPARGPAAKKVLTSPPPQAGPYASALSALIEERRTGR
jgi:prevent-host-death family protein